MSIKHLLACFLLFVTPAFAGSRVVVELFTSQACSACPPADKFLSQLKEHKDIITISWSVDLWDYLGWKDTLADGSYTKRQRGYATGRGDGKVYTPQMIISGGDHGVGSDRNDIEAKIKSAHGLSVEPHISLIQASVSVKLPASSGQYYVLAVPVALEKIVTIGRGENRGNTYTYSRVARGIIPLGAWDGVEKTLTFPRDKIPEDADRIVLLVQSKDDKLNPKRISGAAELVLR